MTYYFYLFRIVLAQVWSRIQSNSPAQARYQAFHAAWRGQWVRHFALVALALSIALGLAPQPVAAQSSRLAQLAATPTALATTTDTTQGAETVLTLPYDWQGNATIPAAELAQVAPPLQAEVLQGDFQLAYVPAETGAVLRILPDPASPGGTMRVRVQLDGVDPNPPAPVGEMLALLLSARLYAPGAEARIYIADATGSTSVPLDGLNWADYQVVRAIVADAQGDTQPIEVGIEWRNAPANGWLELRGLTLASADAADAPPLPTDTPTPSDLPPTPTLSPPTATPTPVQVELPTPTPLATPTPVLIIVTSTPTPIDIFEEATRVAQATEWASILGPWTPTPENLATPTPTQTPLVVINTPTPENAATATQVALFATAVAFTTGTPTPIPAIATIVVATETPTPAPPTPRATNTPRPTATPTPIYILLDNIPTPAPAVPEPVPPVLYNKIVFLTDYRGDPRRPNAMVMNPDGTGIGLLTSNVLYNRASLRDEFSADERFHVYSLREDGGEAYNSGKVQIFYDDSFYSSTHHQLTYFGAGVAWAPAWSPTSETIALVSSESANDEIWVVNRNEWPPMQLTKNDWEWDHHPSFSPDGSEIVFSSNRVTGRRQIWMMSASGGDQRQITNLPFQAWDPVWVKYVDPLAPAEDCDPNYAGPCVPIRDPGDRIVTCAELSAVNFQVVGIDIYGLDTDNDGFACEELPPTATPTAAPIP